MNNSIPNEQEKVICSCTGTTIIKIKQLIAKGANNLDKLASATGATTGCGSCDVTIQEILNKEVQTENNKSRNI